jgi:excisionase family DNA binding protein
MSHNHAETQQYLTKAQVAQVLGVSRRTVDNLMRRRQIPYVKLSARLVRFPRSEVEIKLKKLLINAK